MSFYNITEKPVDSPAPYDAVVLSLDTLMESPPNDAEVYFIDSRDRDELLRICRKIRQCSCPAVYLRPIVAIHLKGALPPYLARIVDGEIPHSGSQNGALQNIRDMARPINAAINSLPDVICRDSNIPIKILRYLYSRPERLEPFRSSETIYGLHYPEVEVFLSKQDESIYNLLDFLTEQKLLAGNFFEKMHRCNQCRSSFINFLEVCPHCQSNNLTIDELIHHFSCAHIGPEADFRQDDKLICPKCDKELRHLGADYDKPSAVYKCNSCGHNSQNPKVTTVCFNCGAKALPENLINLAVQSYTLTALGENAAINGLDNLFQNILERQITILPLPTFKIVLQVEIERIKRYKISTSNLILFQIDNMEKIILHLGHRTKDLFGEMSAIIKAVLRTSDITTSLNESTFLTLMPETNGDGADTALQRLDEQLTNLFNTNLNTQVTLRHNRIELAGNDSVDACIDHLLRHAPDQ